MVEEVVVEVMEANRRVTYRRVDVVDVKVPEMSGLETDGGRLLGPREREIEASGRVNVKEAKGRAE